jgi:lysophospholipase
MEVATLYSGISAAPAHGKAYWIHTDDGVRVRVALWEPEEVSKGTVLVFPGRSDYIELYGHPVSNLVKCGYSTFVIDWRGHGLADRVTEDPKAGHVARFTDYQKDVAAMVHAAETLDLPKPWYLLGHSMGGCIGFRAVLEGLPVAACAFTAPMWDIHISPAQRFAAWPLTWAAQTLGKGHLYAPGYSDQSYILNVGFEENRLTSDFEVFQYWVNQGQKAPELHTGGPSMGWLFQALNETRSLSKSQSPNLPCISFYGDQEEVVSIAAIQDRMVRWPGGSLQKIQNAKHELLLETPETREFLMAKICELFADNL